MSSGTKRVAVIGAGLAGCEAAWQIAKRKIFVDLFEMRPVVKSPAHFSNDFGELVCSNSLRSDQLINAVGLLKQEMRLLDSVVIKTADANAVPAGRALAVDRTGFSATLTERIETHPQINVRREKVDNLRQLRERYDALVVATGPLTEKILADDLKKILGEEYLYFYDAISPIVYADSLDHDVVFRGSRYDEGEGDYLNVPLDKKSYDMLTSALIESDTVPLHPFEKSLYFEGCVPVEELARRGPETLAHGPLKPVGLLDPRSDSQPHAVIQLRQEDKAGVLYNLVGFQTKLRIGDQRRILHGLPGMSEAAFARFGSIHRNTFVNSPRSLSNSLSLVSLDKIYLAGQITGVEGYAESAAIGLLAGIFCSFELFGLDRPDPPNTSAHFALLRHLRESSAKRFQPMNITFGLFPPIDMPRLSGPKRIARRQKHTLLAERAIQSIPSYARSVESL